MKRNACVSRLLIAAMLAGMLAACGGGEIETEPDTSPESVQSENEETYEQESEPETEAEPVFGVPDGTNFDGETISVWYTTTSVSVMETFIDLAGELKGEAIDDGVYNRNLRVQDTLNVTLDYHNNRSVQSWETGAAMERLVRSGDNTYDLFSLVQWNSTKYAYQNMFYNVKDAPYISYDAPWWNYDYMKEMTIGEDKLYCLVGDGSLDTTRCLSCVYYNKAMYEDFYQNADGLYDVVLDGDWNLDLIMKIAEDVYEDTNANNKIDFGDRLGYAINNYSNLDVFIFGGDQTPTIRDENDLPVLNVMQEATEDSIQKLHKMADSCPGGWCYGGDYSDDLRARNSFISGDSMFLFGFFYTAESLREMENDYGILPSPKALETQQNYYTFTHDIIQLMALPTNIDAAKVDATCAVLEALAYYGYEDLLPVYYEQILKSRYARDEKSGQMIELARESMKTDIACLYSSAFGDLGFAPRLAIRDGYGTLSVMYQSKLSAAESGMQELIDQFTGMEE